MNSTAGRACLFDASALVKVYSDEEHSDQARKFFDIESTKYTTPFCFYEALGVIKRKWLKGELDSEKYYNACIKLTTWYCAFSHDIKDIDFTSVEILPHLKRLITEYKIDVSDAFQVISAKYGYFSRLCGDSATILVTADEGLGKAAQREGIKVWYIVNSDGKMPNWPK